MIVTACAGNRQSHQPSPDQIDAVVNNVRLAIQKPPAQRKETECGERAFILAQSQLIRRDLLDYKLIKRKIFIQRANNVIAICVRIGIPPFLLKDITLCIRIPSHVQPVSSPTLAISRRSEQMIYQIGKCIRRFIIHKCGDLSHRRRQSD